MQRYKIDVVPFTL